MVLGSPPSVVPSNPAVLCRVQQDDVVGRARVKPVSNRDCDVSSSAEGMQQVGRNIMIEKERSHVK